MLPMPKVRTLSVKAAGKRRNVDVVEGTISARDATSILTRKAGSAPHATGAPMRHGPCDAQLGKARRIELNGLVQAAIGCNQSQQGWARACPSTPAPCNPNLHRPWEAYA